MVMNLTIFKEYTPCYKYILKWLTILLSFELSWNIEVLKICDWADWLHGLEYIYAFLIYSHVLMRNICRSYKQVFFMTVISTLQSFSQLNASKTIYYPNQTLLVLLDSMLLDRNFDHYCWYCRCSSLVLPLSRMFGCLRIATLSAFTLSSTE